MLKILFLDFDGVLNSEQYLHRCGEYGVVFDPACMVQLQRIVQTTDARIVLTSSWREHWESDESCGDNTGVQINTLFHQYGLSVWDKTPKLRDRREKEIEAWLTAHPDVENFAVVDDRFLSANLLEEHFVKTSNYQSGLNQELADAVIAILNDKG